MSVTFIGRTKGSQWDYIDGIGDLQIGDVVIAPIDTYGFSRTAVVSAVGRRQFSWKGPWSTIYERVQ